MTVKMIITGPRCTVELTEPDSADVVRNVLCVIMVSFHLWCLVPQFALLKQDSGSFQSGSILSHHNHSGSGFSEDTPTVIDNVRVLSSIYYCILIINLLVRLIQPCRRLGRLE